MMSRCRRNHAVAFRFCHCHRLFAKNMFSCCCSRFCQFAVYPRRSRNQNRIDCRILKYSARICFKSIDLQLPRCAGSGFKSRISNRYQSCPRNATSKMRRVNHTGSSCPYDTYCYLFIFHTGTVFFLFAAFAFVLRSYYTRIGAKSQLSFLPNLRLFFCLFSQKQIFRQSDQTECGKFTTVYPIKKALL